MLHLFCMYSFTCSCGAGYIGRTTRRLSDRVREHHPRALTTGLARIGSSSILDHLIDSGHTVDVETAFRPIYRVSGFHSKGVKYRILATAEAIGIRLLRPTLCNQKLFVRALKLNWPKINRAGDNHESTEST